MGDSPEGGWAGLLRGGGGGPKPWGTSSPLATTESSDLDLRACRGSSAPTHVRGAGGEWRVGAHKLLMGAAGSVLTRVPSACVLLCQRGRASSTEEGGQGGTAGRSRALGWWSKGQVEMVNLCPHQPPLSGRDPGLLSPNAHPVPSP